MNIHKILYAIVFCMAFSSCSKWLTLNPEEQIKESELYSKADGFHTQINGVYKELSGSDLYGRELSFGFIEVLAQSYKSSLTSNYGYKNAMKYEYEVPRTKRYIDAFWTKLYNAITNCNSIIHHAKVANPDIFTNKEMERNCILGEAYALRAMIHFDVLRLYAPAPRINRDNKVIPYVKVFPTQIPMKSSTNEVLNYIIEDLLIAHELTKEIDYLNDGIKNVSNRLEFSGNPSLGRFLLFRGYRLNHYAIKALLARVYMYNDDNTNALKYADELIKLNENDWFSYDSESNIKSNGNRKMYGDVIFALFNNKLTDYYNDENNSTTMLVSDAYSNIFDYDSKDYRYKYQYTTNSGYDLSIKYGLATGGKAEYSDKLIPMLRMSEMYYIAAECLFDTNREKAKSYLDFVRNKRRLSTDAVSLPDAANKNDFILDIRNEIEREQFGEGQLFFFNKRFNKELKDSDNKDVKPVYSLPIPDNNNV